MIRVMLGALVAVLALNKSADAQSCALPMIAAQAELKKIPGSDLVTVPVQINGKSKQFLLDVGTNQTEVSQATVAELGLPESTKVSGNIQPIPIPGMIGTGSQIQAPLYETRGSRSREEIRTRVRIGAFTIGSATGHAMQFVVANDVEMGKSKPYDGLLTGDFFRQYDVEMDFSGGKLLYLTPNTCTDLNQVAFWSHSAVAAIPMTMSNGKIQVPVMVEGHAMDAVIDTSSTGTVMRRDIAELTFGLKPDTPDMMPDGVVKDGGDQQVYRHTFRQIAFEGVTATNVPVRVQVNSMVSKADNETVLGSRAQSTDARIPQLTIGMDVLHQLHLYAVYGQKKLYVTQ
jgi:hypothetical protein